jgi:hypothetical protein
MCEHDLVFEDEIYSSKLPIVGWDPVKVRTRDVNFTHKFKVKIKLK